MSNALNAATFAANAAAYAQHRPHYPQALWDWIAGLCPTHERAWDAGCGNGQATVALGGYFFDVLGTDISAEQIAAALPHPNVRYQAIPTEDVVWPANHLDLICVAQALHWFDLARFWPQVHAALKPGGVFVTVAYGLFDVDPVIDLIIETHFYRVVLPWQSAANLSIRDGYPGIVPPGAPIAPPTLAIEVDWTLEQLLGYAGTWSAVARMRQETGRDPIAPLRQALTPVWGDAVHQVRMPLVIKASRN
jgi:SAM-dependent methyltransferase